jgi:Arc/MetJ-type ribon-helix-helix transcriptional regulator
VGYPVAMRLHISIPDELVAELDRAVGERQRSSYISHAVRFALDEDRRRSALRASLGSIEDFGHEWDDDPAEWVRRQRSDDRRAG